MLLSACGFGERSFGRIGGGIASRQGSKASMASRHEVLVMTLEGEAPAVKMLEDVFDGGMDLDGAQMGEEKFVFKHVFCDCVEKGHICSVTLNSQDGWGKLQG